MTETRSKSSISITVLLCILCRLEKRVARLKREIQELRNSSQHSFSSTPTSAQSYTSDRGSFMDPAHLQVFNELLKVPHFSCSYSSLMHFTETVPLSLSPPILFLYENHKSDGC